MEQFPHTCGDEPGDPTKKSSYKDNFPTRVGMNLDIEGHFSAAQEFPHTRGDEPVLAQRIMLAGRNFPTRVGMNRAGGGGGLVSGTISPHVWG